MRIRETRAFFDLAAGIAREVRERGGPCALRWPDEAGRDRLVRGVALALENATVVRVPTGLDQVERVVLELAVGLGCDVGLEVDLALTAEPDLPVGALAALDVAFADQTLVVDGLEHLGAPVADPELCLAVEERTAALRRWLVDRAALLVHGSGRRPREARALQAMLPADPLLELGEGTGGAIRPLWRAYAPDLGSFELELAAAALRGGRTDALDPRREGIDGEPSAPAALRARVFALLPEAERRLLELLAAHGRPMPVDVAARLGARQGLLEGLGAALGFWRETASGVTTDPAWPHWWAEATPGPARRRVHLELAEAFAAAVRPEAPEEAPLHALEAHRHFVAARDLARGLATARHGPGLLVERGRRLSLGGGHAEAAELLGAVVRALDAGELSAAARLRAVARSALHLALAQVRPDQPATAEAEAGLVRSVEDWPERAQLWSRLCRLRLARGEVELALETIDEARAVVPAGPERDEVLVAPAARELLRRGAVLEAMRAWGGLAPETPGAVEVGALLEARLGEGLRLRRIPTGGSQPLVLLREANVELHRADDGWIASLPEVGVSAQGPSPEAALSSLGGAVVAETRRVVAALTHVLGEEDRRLKGRLLGLVDVPASALDAEHPVALWVFGSLERGGDGRIRLRAWEGGGAAYEVPEALCEGLAVEDQPLYGEVRCDDRGAPVGPVLRLDRPARRGDVFDEWRERLGHG